MAILEEQNVNVRLCKRYFTKEKSQSIVGLYDTMKEVLPYITTDLSNAEMLSYMKTVIFMGTTEIHQFRIPVDGLYTNETIRKMKVLVPDLEANRTELLKFIQLPASE